MKFFKYALLFLVVVVGVYLCTGTEQFKDIDPKNLNAKLNGNSYIQSPRDVVITFRNPSSSNEGKLSVTSENQTNGRIKITAIYDIYDDDEICGEKYIFIAEHQKNAWHVLDIRYNWRYCEGYGHTDWGLK